MFCSSSETVKYAIPSMAAYLKASGAPADWPVAAIPGTLGLLVCDQAGNRGAGHVRIAFRGQPDQLQKQWQRPRRVFMLQRTILR